MQVSRHWAFFWSSYWQNKDLFDINQSLGTISNRFLHNDLGPIFFHRFLNVSKNITKWKIYRSLPLKSFLQLNNSYLTCNYGSTVHTKKNKMRLKVYIKIWIKKFYLQNHSFQCSSCCISVANFSKNSITLSCFPFCNACIK